MTNMGVEDFYGTEDPQGKKAGEFSGVSGLIQPPPHDPTFFDASEQNTLLMAQDRDDLREQIEAMKPQGG